MYSEHIIASLLQLSQGTHYNGASLDRDLTRRTVEVGRIIGPSLGCQPSDASLGWFAARFGTPVPPGSRGAVHTLPDGRTGVGLGAGRGVLETRGDQLMVVEHPEPGRYTGAWRLPNIEYGGLL